MLLDDDGRLEIGLHLFVGSKASWDTVPSAGIRYGTMPELLEVLDILHSPGRF